MVAGRAVTSGGKPVTNTLIGPLKALRSTRTSTDCVSPGSNVRSDTGSRRKELGNCFGGCCSPFFPPEATCPPGSGAASCGRERQASTATATAIPATTTSPAAPAMSHGIFLAEPFARPALLPGIRILPDMDTMAGSSISSSPISVVSAAEPATTDQSTATALALRAAVILSPTAELPRSRDSGSRAATSSSGVW